VNTDPTLKQNNNHSLYIYSMVTKNLNIPKGQSSPANLQSGQQASNATRQIPQVSSLATQRHCATPSTSTINLTIIIF
jgi:hypothetical protein